MVLPLSTNVVERLSENSEQASFGGPTRLHNGKKRYSHRRLALPKTRDPTRPAIFQTVSRRTILGSWHRPGPIRQGFLCTYIGDSWSDIHKTRIMPATELRLETVRKGVEKGCE